MKGMVAMEVQVMRRLARAARAAGRDPATDPIPGLRRDVIFCSTADEEAGGWQGANWIVENHPDWVRAAGALNEAGGISMPFAGVRFYPIQVAEKGLVVYRITVKGKWGHGSVPTADNAASLAGQIVTRLDNPGRARLTEAMNVSLGRAIPRVVKRGSGAALLGLRLAARFRPGAIDAGLRRMHNPLLARTVSAMIHDTVSVGIVSAGVKYNVIPGVADLEIDCRILPGTDEPAMREELRRRIGDELWARLGVECEQTGPPVSSPLDSLLYRTLEAVVATHDPAGVPIPVLAPFATDAKHLARIGVPTYGFSPLRTENKDGLLALMHADDERVSVDALAFGLPALWDAVTRFCE
jgi:acetylornithine deacetylase/succinyl-diaminopimelate desuccinylase-like protein